ncbi:MAG TPA: PIG-L family deacetylase [Planctomycetaceae bacterium]|jgi:LmbE family N-acetylglucosaminyl deacetylase
MSSTPLRLLILGAHPDDAEYHAGGLAAIYREAGHVVKMVSVTDGRSGHFRISGKELADIRREEARRSGEVIGATYDVWNNPDGRLLPTIELREQVIRELRTFAPDLVLTHRQNDYHPDHRAVGQAVQDASYLVTVPPICPDTPILRRDPIVGYLPDLFTRPAPLRADVVLDVTDRMETIVQMMARHHSQFFEWIPYNERRSEDVPETAPERLAWLGSWYAAKIAPRAERNRERLIEQYGANRGERIEFCEVFEISEYAAPLEPAARQKLFWFLP